VLTSVPKPAPRLVVADDEEGLLFLIRILCSLPKNHENQSQVARPA
jgi:hypothetical protein